MRTSTRTLSLLAALALFAALALVPAPGGSSPLLGPDVAMAGKRCKAANARPRSLSRKRAAKAVLCVVNKKRRAHGIGRLKRNHKLTKAARRHTRKMGKSGCFAHQCGGEPSLVGRLQKSGYLPCRCSWRIGENIAWGPKHKGTPAKIVRAWMHSPPHRQAILTGAFKDAGIGVHWGAPGKRHMRAGTSTIDFGAKR
jgi:uncharacterized protein YkwD